MSTIRPGSKQRSQIPPTNENHKRVDRLVLSIDVQMYIVSMLQLEISSTHTHHPPHRQRQGWLRVQLMPHKLVFTSLVVNDHNPQSSDDIDRSYNCGWWRLGRWGVPDVRRCVTLVTPACVTPTFVPSTQFSHI